MKTFLFRFTIRSSCVYNHTDCARWPAFLQPLYTNLKPILSRLYVCVLWREIRYLPWASAREIELSALG